MTLGRIRNRPNFADSGSDSNHNSRLRPTPKSGLDSYYTALVWMIFLFRQPNDPGNWASHNMMKTAKIDQLNSHVPCCTNFRWVSDSDMILEISPPMWIMKIAGYGRKNGITYTFTVPLHDRYSIFIVRYSIHSKTRTQTYKYRHTIFFIKVLWAR